MGEDEFRQQVQERGFPAPGVVTYEPHQDPALHAHEFTALVLVTSGELTLGFEDHAVTLQPGESCEVAAGTLHAERTGSSGASALLAKR